MSDKDKSPKENSEEDFDAGAERSDERVGIDIDLPLEELTSDDASLEGEAAAAGDDDSAEEIHLPPIELDLAELLPDDEPVDSAPDDGAPGDDAPIEEAPDMAAAPAETAEHQPGEQDEATGDSAHELPDDWANAPDVAAYSETENFSITEGWSDASELPAAAFEAVELDLGELVADDDDVGALEDPADRPDGPGGDDAANLPEIELSLEELTAEPTADTLPADPEFAAGEIGAGEGAGSSADTMADEIATALAGTQTLPDISLELGDLLGDGEEIADQPGDRSGDPVSDESADAAGDTPEDVRGTGDLETGPQATDDQASGDQISGDQADGEQAGEDRAGEEWAAEDLPGGEHPGEVWAGGDQVTGGETSLEAPADEAETRETAESPLPLELEAALAAGLAATATAETQEQPVEGEQVRFEIRMPDDWHLHVRDGEMLSAVVPDSARHFGRAIIMPNLVPPVVTHSQAVAYRSRIRAAVPEGAEFQPLMTLYLTEQTDPNDLARAFLSGDVAAAKLYPAGATTNSDSGVRDVTKIDPVLERMADIGMPLLVHGEVTDPRIDIFDREAVFIEQVLRPMRQRHPELKVVMEHVTTREGVDYVRSAPEPTAATITVHHLMINRNALFKGGIRPHYFCLPIAKRESHRLALVEAAISGDERFFLGTDSAPHLTGDKESACGCAGIYTAPVALACLAHVFEEQGRLEMLEGFASLNGARFYGMPPSDRRCTLVKTESPAELPKELEVSRRHNLTVFDPERPIHWSVLPPQIEAYEFDFDLGDLASNV